MKKIAFLMMLMLISYEIYAGTVTVKDGGYSYKGDHWDKNSRNYNSFDSNYYRSYQTEQMKVKSAANGVTSADAVKATVEQKISKREVMKQIYEKAKTGGKALGKGASSLGSAVVRQHPLGRAFWLALGALELSKYFWSDEKGDFVKQNDEKTYFVVKTNEANSDPSQPMTKSQLDDWCAGTVELSADYDGTKHGKVKRFCTDVSIERELNSKSLLAKCGFENPSFNAHRACVSRGYLTGFAVRVIRVADNYVPITLDDFIDEVTPEADSNPNDWVETSGVQPTDEPKVEVPAGTVAQTNPYTDPKDGKTKQTRWDFEPNGKVRETEIPRPDLTPDSPEAPRLDPPKQDDTGTDTGDKGKEKDKDGEAEKDKDKDKSDTQDLCEKNPDILACDKQPEKSEIDDFPEIPTETVNLKFSPDNVFPSQAVCPADVSFVVFDKTYAFSLKPACDLAQSMRAFIIATAFLMAAFFVVRTVQSEV